MLKSLDKVVIILIVLASLLSFVVLYNLSNININERKREIATLKVLGFYPYEVDGYITRENIILTFIGILFGLLAGSFLTNIVISTVEIEKARFIRFIKPLSFLYSALITACFTLIVNFFTHFTLKKIDMIDSLKSVE
jgi:putative ABC transport system permease protein